MCYSVLESLFSTCCSVVVLLYVPAAAPEVPRSLAGAHRPQPSIFQWGNPLVVVGKPMNSCTKRLKIGRQYSDNGAYTTTTIAKRRCAVPISDIEKISTMSRRRRQHCAAAGMQRRRGCVALWPRKAFCFSHENLKSFSANALR